jgi:signal transduction histidine kinase
LRFDVDLPATGLRHLGTIEDLYGNLREQVHRVMLFLATLILLTSVAILFGFPFFFRTNLLRPLYNLVVATRWVENENSVKVVPVQFEDEIGHLTRSFNAMIENIQTVQNELRRKNETLQKYTRDRERDLDVLYQVAAIANAPVKMDLLMGNLLTNVLKAAEGSMGAILFFDAGSTFLMPIAHQGLSAQYENWLGPSSPLDRLRRQVLEQKAPIVIQDLEGAFTGGQELEEHLAYLGVPIMGKSTAFGVLELYNDVSHQFLVENVALLSAVAGQLGVAIESIRLRHQAEASAILEERQRLARDLHDSVTQTLYSLTLLSQAGRDLLEDGNLPRLEDCMLEIGDNATRALKEMRLMLYQLRPELWDETNLAAALRHRLDTVENHSGIRANLSVRGKIVLPAEIQAQLYYIIIEALNNVLKHSQASRVDVDVRHRSQQLFLKVRDDGVGFRVEECAARGFGLKNMAERAERIGADFKIVSSEGVGTAVKISLDQSHYNRSGKGDRLWEKSSGSW